MTEMFGEAWSPMSVPDLAPDDDAERHTERTLLHFFFISMVSSPSTRLSRRQMKHVLLDKEREDHGLS